MLDSRIFRRHAKGVKAHGVQYIKAPHGAETGNHIANGIVAHVAHMQIAGGIREHLQYIGFGFGRINLAFKSVVLFPVLLPFLFYGMGSIFFFHHIYNLPGLSNP